MSKQLKAKKIVESAVGSFANAINQINKANDILTAEVQADENKMLDITQKITDLYKQMDAVQADKIDKNATIIQNKELIARLDKFVG